MTWWTHIAFPGSNPENHTTPLFREKFSSGLLYRAIRQYVYDNFVDILYVFLRIFTYLYLIISVVTFFFPAHVPHSFVYIVDALSEPYLGALGIYVIVKQLERRRKPNAPRSGIEFLPIFWLIFLAISSAAIFYSDNYHVGELYQTVVTNALAVMIIRIGTILRY